MYESRFDFKKTSTILSHSVTMKPQLTSVAKQECYQSCSPFCNVTKQKNKLGICIVMWFIWASQRSQVFLKLQYNDVIWRYRYNFFSILYVKDWKFRKYLVKNVKLKRNLSTFIAPSDWSWLPWIRGILCKYAMYTVYGYG